MAKVIQYHVSKCGQELLEGVLNEYSQTGWELVSFTLSEDLKNAVVVFEKETEV